MDAAHSGPPTALRLARRTYIVDRRFQYKYTALLSGLGALMSALFGVLMYLAHQETLDDVFGGGSIPADVAARSVTLLWLIAGMAVLMAVAFALFGLLITHRVAGPVYVMSQFVSVLARGRYPKMRPLRRHDELKEFFDRFQRAIEALRERELEEAQTLEKALERLAPAATTPEVTEAMDALRAMHARKCEATAPPEPADASRRKSAA
jgi:hypothetical protein